MSAKDGVSDLLNRRNKRDLQINGTAAVREKSAGINSTT
jgi:hypothetical protein